MAFDGYFIHHLNKELEEKLLSGRVNKIYQPSDYELVFLIRANRQNYKLFLSIHPMHARYHLTNETFFNPEFAPNFCMVLRKYLEGSTLKSIQQLELDRLTTFVFQKYDELGDAHTYHLTIELMGRHSNIFLIEPQTNIILDCTKHIPSSKSTYRTIRPNTIYTLPPYQQRVNIFHLTLLDINHLCQTINVTDDKAIQSTFQGISRSTIQWIFQQQSLQQIPFANALYQLTKEKTVPVLTKNDFFAIQTDGVVYDTLSHLLDDFYVEKAKLERIQQLSGNLLHQLKQLVTKNEHKLKKLTQDYQKSENADDYRIKGDILTTFSYQVNKGAKQITLPNFYNDNQPIVIDLKEHKHAMQNAQDYFKKYQKLKLSTQHISEQIHLTKQELAYLQSVFVQINMATTKDLIAIKEELVETGYLKQKQTYRKKKTTTKLPPLIFQSSGGTTILVGRNNLQNDQLTLKQAKKSHIWLHAKDIPGAHVIVEHDAPSQETLVQAATIAAYYSAFQLSANVPVDYVAVKHIKKPNGAKPGYVIYEQQKTLFVSPTKTFVDNLLVKS